MARFKAYAVDLETTGLDPRKDRILGLGYHQSDTNEGFLTKPEEIQAFLNNCVEDNIWLIWQGGKFDQVFLLQNTGILHPNTFDTLLAASILPKRPPNLKLDTLVSHYFKIPPYKEQELLKDMGAVPIETVKEYCLTDCKYTMMVARHLYPQILEQNLWSFYSEVLLPISSMLAEVEHKGMAIDREALSQQFIKLSLEIENLKDSLRIKHQALIGPWEAANPKKKFNFNSPKQVLWLVKEQLKLPCKNTKGKESTQSDVLEKYVDEHEVIRDILDLKEKIKLNGFLADWEKGLDTKGRLHTHYNLDIARTGRLSSSDPNLQQVPRGPTRSLFIAKDKDHSLVIIDYAQIEPRIVAHYSEEPVLLQAFRDDDDFYSVVLIQMLDLKYTPQELKNTKPELRALAKTISLAILYGIGPSKLAAFMSKGLKKSIGYRQACSYIEGYFRNIPGFAAMRDRFQQEALDTGKVVNLLGRPVYMLPEEVYHKAVNRQIKSSASDLCCYSQLKLKEQIKEMDAALIHLVHDEVIYEVAKKDVDKFTIIAKDVMENCFPLNVPLKVEVSVGQNWGCK